MSPLSRASRQLRQSVLAALLLFIGGQVVERILPLDGPALGGVARVLLVQERAARRDDRVDAYLAAPAESWLSGLLKGQRRLLFDLGVFLTVLGAVMLALSSLTRIAVRAGQTTNTEAFDMQDKFQQGDK